MTTRSQAENLAARCHRFVPDRGSRARDLRTELEAQEP